jgi:hypothetical protein
MRRRIRALPQRIPSRRSWCTDASAAVGLATLHEKQTNLFGQTGVLLPAATLRFLSLSVKPAATDVESRAEFLHRVAILGMHLAHYFEAFQG